MSDSGKILHQQCIICWQSACQFLVKSTQTIVNSGFYEVATKRKVSSVSMFNPDCVHGLLGNSTINF